MTHDRLNDAQKPDGSMPAAPAGNASNPSPQDNDLLGASDNQLLDKKAEKYLRESGVIEDMPDPEEQQNAEQQLSDDKDQ